MLLYSNKARQAARESIQDIHGKIAGMPLNAFPGGLADVQTIHLLLEILDVELRREIKANSKRAETGRTSRPPEPPYRR